MGVGGLDDIARDVAAIERVGAAFGNAPERGGVGGIDEQGTDGQRLALCRVEIGARTRLRQAALARQQRVQPRRHGEAVLRQRNGGREQRGPFQSAMPSVRDLEQPHGAGHADRLAANNGGVERHRLAVLHEAVRRRCGGRRLAAVVGDEPLRLAVVHKHERAAAQARGLRLHQPQHQLHGNGRVHRAAALLQYPCAGVDGQRICRDDHPLLRCDRGLGRPARRNFRRRILCRR